MYLRKLLPVVVLATLAISAAHATENGGGAYPNGAEGVMTGFVPPPPGYYLINYALYYGADKVMDDAGKEIPVEFDLEVWGDVVRIINVTDKKFLGGTWVQHVFIPFLSVDISAQVPDGAGGLASVSDDNIGLGDIIVDPVILAWHRRNWHWAAGVDVYVPVGDYTEGELANIGRNYWTLEPVVAITYMNRHGYEASAKIMYDINFENSDTDYESGDELHVDFAASKSQDAWTFGVGGYYYEQVTDDEGLAADGTEVPANKGKAVALGPHIGYKKGQTSFILKYQKEFDVENKPEGERFWFKIVTAL